MMTWHAISKARVQTLVDEAYNRMSVEQKVIWKLVQVPLHKWQQSPWGELGDGFWVVGIIGSTVLWYNDIEHGFNLSSYIEWGTIGEYCCDQYNLEFAVQLLLSEIKSESPSGGFEPPTASDSA